MAGVLFLDVSTTVGWAWGTADHLEKGPIWGVWQLGAVWELGRRLVAFENELADAIYVHQPDLIGVEAPILGGKGSAATARLLISLVGCAHSVAYRWERRVVERNSQTIRAEVLGRCRMTDGERLVGGNIKSALVAPWIEARDWRIHDHNARDAAVGWAYELGVRAPGRKAAA